MVSTNTKLAEAIKLAEDAMAYVPEYFANKHGMLRRMAALKEVAAHEQAQADDWQHLKPYGYAPGNYMSRCRTCGDTPVMDKRAITCRPCAEAKFAASQAQAERVGLTDEQIAEGRYLTWAAEPDDAPEAWSFMRGARWADKHFGIGATTGKEPGNV